MRYLYYPGCSLEGSARPYDESLRAVFRALGVDLVELADWNCCGATMYMSVNETASIAIAARNLALAEQDGGADLVAPCSACYAVLLKANRFLQESPDLKARVDDALGTAGLQYRRPVRVRHPLDVLANDVGIEAIGRAATRRLDGVSFAPYYGCQIVRPERGFDDTESPTTMERLFERLVARAVDFPMKTRCCGGMLMTTFPDVSLALVKDLLACAVDNGAQCIATTCPLCQNNLELYQTRVNRQFQTNYRLPVIFFTQLLGAALGCSATELGLRRHVIPVVEPLAALVS